MLDEEVECPALGGNIFPVNGCTIDKGMLTNLRIPENRVARLQMIEYIRAFMAGRVGWAQLDCLLIISGAFGLFKRDRIIEIGGYLTSSGEYNKDTVGEDMELVVRLNRHMLEKKQKFKIKYSYNANCWTEVPESFRVLVKELQSLGLAVEVINEKNEVIHFGKEETTDNLPRLGFSLNLPGAMTKTAGE